MNESGITADHCRKGLEVFRARLRDAEAHWLNTCVRCGLCAESCHYFLADPQPENLPAHKLERLASVFRRQYTFGGKYFPTWTGARDFNTQAAEDWVDSAFGRCTLCGRCSLHCSTGVHLASLMRAARGALTEMGLTPPGLKATAQRALDTGNNMGISREDWLETVQWLEEELQTETGDPNARIPVDKVGAKVLLTVNPREPKFFPMSLLASAKVFWAAGEDWTLSSEGWDLTNYGLFEGSPERAGQLARNMVGAAEKLGVQILALGECGHGFAAARWEGPEWLERNYPFRMCSVLELLDDYLSSGRIQVVDCFHEMPMTLHDPCNLVRHGGVVEPQRRILRRIAKHFTEMTPHGIQNYCCSGGGGSLSMSNFKDRRIQSGQVKAEQIRTTGAQMVVAPCHNCQDQLAELSKEYKLGIKTTSVTELLADALKPRP